MRNKKEKKKIDLRVRGDTSFRRPSQRESRRLSATEKRKSIRHILGHSCLLDFLKRLKCRFDALLFRKGTKSRAAFVGLWRQGEELSTRLPLHYAIHTNCLKLLGCLLCDLAEKNGNCTRFVFDSKNVNVNLNVLFYFSPSCYLYTPSFFRVETVFIVLIAGDRSSIAAKRNLFEQQAPPPRPPGPKKAPGITRTPSSHGTGNGVVQQPPATPSRPPGGMKPTPSYPVSGATPPPRPPMSIPKRSPSAPNMPQQQAPFKKAPPASGGPPPPPTIGSAGNAYGAPPPPSQPTKTAPKKLQPNMIPPGLVVAKPPSVAATSSSSPTYGSTPPTYGSTPPSAPLSAPPIPPPNPFASRQPAPITPPLSPNTTRAQISPVSPSPDNTEKKESFFNSLFGKKKAKERKYFTSLHNIT